jgi:maltooligosyltrehalose trehalohydrolase
MGIALGRYLFLIAESDLNDPRVVRPVAADGWGFDAQGNEDFHHALHALLTGENTGYYMDYGQIADLAGVLGENFCLYGRFSKHRQKVHGCSAKDIEGSRFVAFVQNHDQTGNRGKGERLCHLLAPGQIKLGAAVTLLSPFVPMLFQGEEWAASSPFCYFADVQDEDIRAAIRKGRHEEFAFSIADPAAIADPLDETTWRHCRLHWEERGAAEHHEILDWYRTLIHLRRQEPDFEPGPLDIEGVEYAEKGGWLSFRRGRFRVVCNFLPQPQLIACCERDILELVLASAPVEVLDTGEIAMPAHSVAILENVTDKNASIQGG